MDCNKCKTENVAYKVVIGAFIIGHLCETCYENGIEPIKKDQEEYRQQYGIAHPVRFEIVV